MPDAFDQMDGLAKSWTLLIVYRNHLHKILIAASGTALVILYSYFNFGSPVHCVGEITSNRPYLRVDPVTQMLTIPGHVRSSDSPEKQLRRLLETVPTPILKMIAFHGVHIILLKEGTSLLDSGILEEADLKEAFTDLKFLENSSRKVCDTVEQRLGPKFAHLRRKAMHSRLSSSEETQFESLRFEAVQVVWMRIHEETYGRVSDPFDGCGLNDVEWNRRHMLPTTMEEIAVLHGAASSNEIEEYVRRMTALNPDLLAWLSTRKLPQDDRPLEKRSFVIGNVFVLAPAYCFHRSKGRSRPFMWEYMEAMRDWESGNFGGQYFPFSRLRLLLLSYKLPTGTVDRTVSIHEIGHAFYDSLRRLDRSWFSDFIGRWLNVYSKRCAGDGVFPTDYSGTNPVEFFAEVFALVLDSSNGAGTIDDEARRLMKEAIERAGIWEESVNGIRQ